MGEYKSIVSKSGIQFQKTTNVYGVLISRILSERIPEPLAKKIVEDGYSRRTIVTADAKFLTTHRHFVMFEIKDKMKVKPINRRNKESYMDIFENHIDGKISDKPLYNRILTTRQKNKLKKRIKKFDNQLKIEINNRNMKSCDSDDEFDWDSEDRIHYSVFDIYILYGQLKTALFYILDKIGLQNTLDHDYFHNHHIFRMNV